jgi:hypothetical protein
MFSSFSKVHSPIGSNLLGAARIWFRTSKAVFKSTPKSLGSLQKMVDYYGHRKKRKEKGKKKKKTERKAQLKWLCFSRAGEAIVHSRFFVVIRSKIGNNWRRRKEKEKRVSKKK